MFENYMNHELRQALELDHAGKNLELGGLHFVRRKLQSKTQITARGPGSLRLVFANLESLSSALSSVAESLT